MTVLQDTCHRFERSLEVVGRQCETMLTDLHEFERTLDFKPVEIVSKRLIVIAWWVRNSALVLHEVHGGKGHVYVVMENGKLVPYWFKNKLTVADKKWWKAHGSPILSIEETINTIMRLQHDMASGNWADVVIWINRHGV